LLSKIWNSTNKEVSVSTVIMRIWPVGENIAYQVEVKTNQLRNQHNSSSI
jgi:hypothetical protein